ncbi:MAG: hypothetical protein AAGI68_06130 [Planctomycetota bacterium]
MSQSLMRAMVRAEPRDRRRLRALVEAWFGLRVVDRAWVSGSTPPLDYLCHALGIGQEQGDCVVWASRGAGKTVLAALATVLEMVFVPGVQVRVLGGSLEQAAKVHEHLVALLDRPMLRPVVAGVPTLRRVGLINGSRVELLAGSQRSVRGVRVHRLRVDEVDELEPEVWAAAQHVTRSGVVKGRRVVGSIEALSTMHRAGGLMSGLVGDASGGVESPQNPSASVGFGGGRKVFRWTGMDVAARCPAELPCAGCVLWDDCGGVLKGASGFVPVEDLMRQRERSSDAAWSAEVMCRRPSVSDLVYPGFERSRHVMEVRPFGERGAVRVGGMDFGIREAAVVLWGWADGVGMDAKLHVEGELIVKDRTLEQVVHGVDERLEGEAMEWVGVDPAGGARSAQSGLTDLDVLRSAGWRPRARRSRVAVGIERVRRRLDRGLLTIQPRCVGLIAALQTYHFDRERPGREEPVKDGPDHAADALRYLVMNLESGGEGLKVRGYR